MSPQRKTGRGGHEFPTREGGATRLRRDRGRDLRCQDILMTTRVSALHRNAFHLLGATVRDDRQRIIVLAEERLLDLDHGECTKARSDLLSPRARLGAEVSWLPGVSPRRATQLAEQVLKDPAVARREQGLPTLAQANLLAASLEVAGSAESPNELAARIVETANIASRVSAADVIRDINEDRTVARFPLIASQEQVEQELVEQGRYYRAVLRAALNSLEPRQLVAAMTQAVDIATQSGEAHAPPLIDDLVDVFEVEAQQFLSEEAQNINTLVAAIRTAAPLGEAGVAPLVAKLMAVARNWDSVAQPIQLSVKARGTQHEMSKELGLAIRSLAVDLFNEHQMLEQARRITELLRDVFAELPEFSEQLEKDSDALDDIEESRVRAKGRRAEWAREISYKAEIGMVIKNVLNISPDGVAWKGRQYPLEEITRVRWGGTRHSVNGIPTGTTYTIAFGDAHSEAIVECRREEVFSAFIDRLWKAVGVRLLIERLHDLRAGNDWSVGGTVVRDAGITLTRHKFWTREPVVRPWSLVYLWSHGGALNIAATDDRKVSVSLPYIHTQNVHVLEHALQMARRRPGLQRLSELLDQT